MKLPTTLLVTPREDLKANKAKTHQKADLHKQGQKTDMIFRNVYMKF
jgi:hypothetical protein